MTTIAFLIGLVVGGCAGYFLCGLMTIAAGRRIGVKDVLST